MVFPLETERRDDETTQLLWFICVGIEITYDNYCACSAAFAFSIRRSTFLFYRFVQFIMIGLIKQTPSRLPRPAWDAACWRFAASNDRQKRTSVKKQTIFGGNKQINRRVMSPWVAECERERCCPWLWTIGGNVELFGTVECLNLRDTLIRAEWCLRSVLRWTWFELITGSLPAMKSQHISRYVLAA